MAGVVNEIWQCHLCVNYQNTGVSYTHWLRSKDWTQAAAETLEIAQLYSWLLPAGAWIEWVDTRQPGHPGPSWPLQQDPITALKKSNGDDFWDPPNDASSGLNIIWRPYGHKAFWRRLWYLPDGQVSENEWARRGLQVPRVTPPRPANPITAAPEDLYQYVFARLRDLTTLAVQLPDLAPGVQQWETFDFRQVSFGKIGSSKVRPRYHRMSWHVLEWEKAVHFSPCGSAVTARRASYANRCRFYVDGLEQTILFYYSKPEARILPFATIFDGKYGIEDYRNAGGVGERSGTPFIPWSPGFSWSDAPGIAPTGGPNAFLGLASKPYDDSLDTPLNLRPACDMPVPVPIDTLLDDNTFEEDNTTKFVFEADDFDLSQTEDGEVFIQLKTHYSLTIDVSAGTPTYTDTDEITFQSEDGFYLGQTTPGIVVVGKDSFWPSVDTLAADVHNYNPGPTNLVVFSTSSIYNVTGFAGGFPGRRLKIRSLLLSRPIMLKHRDPGSAGGNQIEINGSQDYPLLSGEEVELVYDPSLSRWTLNPRFGFNPQAFPHTGAFYLARLADWGNSEGFTLGYSDISEDLHSVFIGKALFQGGISPAPSTSIMESEQVAHGQVGSTGAHTYEGIEYQGPGQIIQVVNVHATASVTFKHQSGTATPPQRITCPGLVDLVLGPGEGATFISVIGVANQWKVVGRHVPAGTLVWSETPSGTIDGINNTFALSHSPLAGQLLVFVNGVKQSAAAYTPSGPSIVFNPGFIPQPGDELEAMYAY